MLVLTILKSSFLSSFLSDAVKKSMRINTLSPPFPPPLYSDVVYLFVPPPLPLPKIYKQQMADLFSFFFLESRSSGIVARDLPFPYQYLVLAYIIKYCFFLLSTSNQDSPFFFLFPPSPRLRRCLTQSKELRLFFPPLFPRYIMKTY